MESIIDDPASSDPLSACRVGGWAYAYHGTSSVYSGSIEEHGLDPTAAANLHEPARHVLDLYRYICWGGVDTRGRAVLEPWSIGYDLNRHGVRHVYLAESYHRAAIYANVSGGEFSRSLLVAIEDLLRFTSETALREEHEDWLRNVAAEIWAPIDQYRGLDHEVQQALRRLRDLECWQTQVRDLIPLRDQLAHTAVQHCPVIYLVRLPEESRGRLCYSRSMGIELRGILPSAWLIAKAVDVKHRGPVPVDQTLKHLALWSGRIASC